MGGGDLNSKKSWHPNTMKNQERVWKAEQAAADEKKRIMELQRERAEERDRAELNDLAKRSTSAAGISNDNRLHWMYDKPDKKTQQEDFLLGKAIDKSYDQHEKSEQEVIPAVARRVVGSSMLATAGDTQVDLARKIREDPLLLVKERERAARAALLNNPLQRRKLTELLRKEQEHEKESKTKKKSKKKEKNLDDMLASKLNALRGEKGIDVTALLASDDSNANSSSEEQEKKKKKKRKKHKLKKSKKSKDKKKSSSESDTDSSESKKYKSKYKDKKKNISNKHSDSDKRVRHRSKDQVEKLESTSKEKFQNTDSRKRKSESDISDNDDKSKRRKTEMISKRKIDTEYKSQRSEFPYNESRRDSRRSPEHKNKSRVENQWKRPNRGGLSEKEKAERLAAMAVAGAEREVQRSRRVADQRAADAAVATAAASSRPSAASEAHTLPDSLESRIHSNRHYIQRGRQHMNEHFARR